MLVFFVCLVLYRCVPYVCTCFGATIRRGTRTKEPPRDSRTSSCSSRRRVITPISAARETPLPWRSSSRPLERCSCWTGSNKKTLLYVLEYIYKYSLFVVLLHLSTSVFPSMCQQRARTFLTEMTVSVLSQRIVVCAYYSCCCSTVPGCSSLPAFGHTAVYLAIVSQNFAGTLFFCASWRHLFCHLFWCWRYNSGGGGLLKAAYGRAEITRLAIVAMLCRKFTGHDEPISLISTIIALSSPSP